MVKKRVVKRRKRKFPILGSLLLLVGIVWLLQAWGKMGSFPWFPAIIIVVAIGLIFNKM
jgi:hypothetical protein